MPVPISALLRDEPYRWGLRGDPHLWREMRQRLEAVPCPASADALVAAIEAEFEELTGCSIDHAEPFHVEKYSHGGMSSGYVDPRFWRESAIPLLRQRHAELCVPPT